MGNYGQQHIAEVAHGLAAIKRALAGEAITLGDFLDGLKVVVAMGYVLRGNASMTEWLDEIRLAVGPKREGAQ